MAMVISWRAILCCTAVTGAETELAQRRHIHYREQPFLPAGSTLYTVFEVQAWVALVVSAAAVPATWCSSCTQQTLQAISCTITSSWA